MSSGRVSLSEWVRPEECRDSASVALCFAPGMWKGLLFEVTQSSVRDVFQ